MATKDFINRITQGDCLDLMKRLDDESVDCIVTSPPYWALRDYQSGHNIWDGDKDCEHEWESSIKSKKQTPQRDVSGGFSGKDKGTRGEQSYNSGIVINEESAFCSRCGAWRGSLGLEPTFELYIKHLCDIFDEAQRTLKKTGTCWVNIGDTYGGSGNSSSHKKDTKNLGYTTSDMGASKGNCNATRGMEKCLLQIPHRFAIEMCNRGWKLRNTIIWHKNNCMPSSVNDRFTVDFEYVFFFVKSRRYHFEQQFEKLKEESKRRAMRGNNQNKYSDDNHLPIGVHVNTMSKKREYKGYNNMESAIANGETVLNPKGRNKRTVWNINPKPFKEAHFAVFPEKLIETPIKAGCPKDGVVMDPFMGSGTTARACKRLGRDYIGFDLNTDYVDLSIKLTKKVQGIKEGLVRWGK